MNKKENSGYLKTHQRIQDSLLTLLGQKNLQNITVNDVCRLADINRSTFYAHYQDMYAVMEAIEQVLETALLEEYSKEYKPGTDIMTIDYLAIVIRHIKEHRVFYLAYLSDSSSAMLANSMELLRTQIVLPFYRQIDLSERRGMYYFDFFKSGFITVLRRWLEDDCPEEPQKLADILFSCLPSFPPDLLTF